MLPQTRACKNFANRMDIKKVGVFFHLKTNKYLNHVVGWHNGLAQGLRGCSANHKIPFVIGHLES